MTKVPLICQTPVTLAMEMNNYISEKGRKGSQIGSGIHSKKWDGHALALIEEIYEKIKK